jgi:hypothetical protein
MSTVNGNRLGRFHTVSLGQDSNSYFLSSPLQSLPWRAGKIPILPYYGLLLVAGHGRINKAG